MVRPVALVTGGSCNIGRAIAARFAPSYDVIIGDLVEPAQPLPPSIRWIPVDVRDYSACERLISAVGAEDRGLDVVIHSAGITAPAIPIRDLKADEWARVIEVNLTGAFNVMRSAIEPLCASRGCGVLISSRAARVGYAALSPSPAGTKPHYCASKAGVISLTRSLAIELAHAGVRVNCIAPGSIEGTMIPRDRWQEIAAHVPLGRLGRPDEIAEVCWFLCSAAASYITGHVLDVNGGTWMN